MNKGIEKEGKWEYEGTEMKRKWRRKGGRSMKEQRWKEESGERGGNAREKQRET